MSVYRLYFKPHNRAEQSAIEFFVDAYSEKDALTKVLHSGQCPDQFATVNIDVINNGIIVPERRQK